MIKVVSLVVTQRKESLCKVVREEKWAQERCHLSYSHRSKYLREAVWAGWQYSQSYRRFGAARWQNCLTFTEGLIENFLAGNGQDH